MNKSSVIIELTKVILPSVHSDRVLSAAQVSSWLRKGMSPERVAKLVSLAMSGDSRGQVFENLKLVLDGFTGFITENANIERYTEAGINMDTPCSWTLGDNDNHCPDCLANSQLGVHPFSFWVERGLPGEGATYCGEYCNCEIVEES